MNRVLHALRPAASQQILGARLALLVTTWRVLILTGLLMAPVSAMVYSTTGNLGIKSQGAGLVLYVTLQRQAMG